MLKPHALFIVQHRIESDYRDQRIMEAHSSYYGNIMDVDTTGASLETGKQEGLDFGGVEASKIIARRDLNNLEKYKMKIKRVSEKTNIDAAVIAAIMSRESHAGTILEDGWGDHGNGFGLMQVDRRYHKLVGTWDSEEHINQATLILCSMIDEIKKKIPLWTNEQQLKGGISAYNAGLKNVQSYERMDIGTTKNDYANDVVARAKFYKTNGY
ncbi:lysozyme g-like protein 2 isoform X1 [Crotalus tigris]|uniref:lysozyme g-like protein 2 isoform X1 n=1 Tax=Crotalus tigris TaxID=88082 RepID=UPI00192F4972|nr:lysozyme g-like protein 2 isoform X1 [Crotalus tigris]